MVSSIGLMPVLAIAQDATPPADSPVDIQAEQPAPEPPLVVEVPPAVESPPVVVESPVDGSAVAEPTDGSAPTEPVPTIAQEPTVAVPTVELVPTEAPSPTATLSPTPTERIWVNSDTVALNDGATGVSLAPGESKTITLAYTVTTPRTSTTVTAELAGASEEWRIDSASFADSNPAATRAIWTDYASTQPGNILHIPVTITAPAVLYADQNVALRVWSSADTVSGPEAGFDTSVATISAIAQINTDSIDVVGMPNLSLASGELSTVTVNYRVTTFRTGTTLQALIVDEAGNVADGWTVVSQASGTDGVTDATALVPGSSFESAFVVTAPTYVHADQTVSLRLSSTVANPFGNTPVRDGLVIATLHTDATPADPTLACDTVDTQIHCTLDPDRSDVTSATVAMSAPEGWSFEVNGQRLMPDAPLGLDAAGALPEALTITPSYDGGCFEADASLAASITLHLAYHHVDAIRLDAALTLPVPTFPSIPPIVSIDPVEFGAIRWNGETWATAATSTTATIRQEGCGTPGAYDVQVQVFGASPGVQPVIVGTSSEHEGISGSANPVNPNGAPVTVAHLHPEFSGTGTLTIDFELSPTSDADPGTHAMTIEIAVVNGQ